MLKKSILLTAGTIALAATAEAQAIHGTMRAQGGFGTAQNKADIHLECDLPGIQLKPFVGIAGVDKEKWNLTTDRDFHFIVTEHYKAVREEDYDGHTLMYGTDFRTTFSPSHELEGRFVGSNMRMDGTGSLFETFDTRFDGKPLMVNRQYKLPSRNADIYDGNISYTYRTGRKGESIKVGYRINSQSATDNQDEIYENSSVAGYQTSLLFEQEVKEVRHTGTLDWNRPLGKGQLINVGFEYENRNLKSDDSQKVDDPFVGKGKRTGQLDYQTQTYDYHVAYSLQMGPIVANARVDLQHHDIRNYVKLDDVVPTARVAWKISEAHSLTAQYGQRIIRPDFARLNPFSRSTASYELSYGSIELRGMHVGSSMLIYKYKKGSCDVTATLNNIVCNDGFNALWYENARNERIYTWANNGKRRAWSFRPEVNWQPARQTRLYAKGEVIWDKRIADAIGMYYEHWGATAELGGTHSFGNGLNINLHGRYSEGNTLDLYSHEGRSLRLGGFFQKSIGKVEAKLAYDYSEYARTVIAQGVAVPGPGFYGWTGSEYRRPESRHNLTASLAYSF